MPKVISSLSNKLRGYVKEFRVFSTDGEVLHCKVCDKNVTAERRSQVNQHLETKLHISRSNSGASSSSKLITTAFKSNDGQHAFEENLTNAFISADIPLYKLRNETLRKFLQSYIPSYNLPSETTARRHVESLHNSTLERIRIEVGEQPIYVVVDESCDYLNRSVCNVIVGILSNTSTTKTYLIHCAVLPSTNHSTIAKAVNDALLLLWDGKLHYDRLWLLLSDAASYMIKMGTGLKVLYPNVIHITCIAHALHRVAEVVRDQFPDVNELITTGKQIFVKASARREDFRSKTSLPLPPKAVITRWGTWLQTAFYYASNFEKVKNYISEMADESSAITACKEVLKKSNLSTDLVVIATCFRVIADSITKLEKEGMKLNESVSIVHDLEKELGNGGPSICKYALGKMTKCLVNNPGWKRIIQINECLNNNSSLPSGMSVSEVCAFKYAPVTSVSVERSFSELKAFMKFNRTSFDEKNFAQHFMIYSNRLRL